MTPKSEPMELPVGVTAISAVLAAPISRPSRHHRVRQALNAPSSRAARRGSLRSASRATSVPVVGNQKRYAPGSGRSRERWSKRVIAAPPPARNSHASVSSREVPDGPVFRPFSVAVFFRSAATISRTRSGKGVLWRQPSFSRALVESPCNR